MKYTVNKCPACGGPPVAELNTVPVFAGLVEGWKRGRESFLILLKNPLI